MKHTFTAFLGTGNYQPCSYEIEGQKSPEVTYVQNAIRRAYIHDENNALIFCTEGAKAKHWEGLLAESQKLRLTDPCCIDIPNGANTEELWNIFSTVCDHILEDSALLFDLTHSLRSLPLIMSIILNYLNTVKATELKSCLYGAYEVRDSNKNIAPVFQLSEFFVLNEWTRAIRDFIQYGQSRELYRLANGDLGKILRETRGQDESAFELRYLIGEVHKFSEAIQCSDCPQIFQMEFRSNICNRLNAINERNILPQLSPVLDQICELFQDYEDASILNGLRAARFCAARGMVPQGYTIAQETIVSLIIEEHQSDLHNMELITQRRFISALLGVKANKVPRKDWHGPLENPFKQLAQSIAAKLPQALLDAYDPLTQGRNAVNHGGTGEENQLNPSKEAEKLKSRLQPVLEYYHLTDALEYGL